jgi:hypothetical protein
MEKLKDQLESKGINPDRLMLEWVSASEGQRFVETIRKMEKLEVDEAEIELSKMIFREPEEKSARKETAGSDTTAYSDPVQG